MSALPALDDSPPAQPPRAKAEPWPRLIRISRAHTYLGMCRRVFNATVRPHVRVVRIGKQGKAVDRHELDAFADAYVARHAIDKAPPPGNPEPASERRHATAGAKKPWRERENGCRASRKGTASGTSTRSSTENGFTRALELVRSKKPSRS
ncbi:hypothetical protein [Methyloversatilis discipulorum]|uniref:hypothetical protein n=1 Tax=Methyloversatilis discipulorum TaxID=1119528 RepID=UPI0018DEE079|nr:hypothetical protein [Methyloversatilis discipulorum]